MKTTVSDPWSSLNAREDSSCENNSSDDNNCSSFEDSFVLTSSSSTSNTDKSEELPRLPDSEQYLARLDSRLKAIKGGTSKRDLINSLSVAKEDCIARLITAGDRLEKPEEKELAANPIIRHIAPHLQALTANELVHLLKADALQAVVNELNNQDSECEDPENKSTADNRTENQTPEESL